MAYVLSQVQGCLQRRHISSRKLTEIEVQCIADTGDGRVALSHLIGDIMQSTRCRVLAAAALFGILAGVYPLGAGRFSLGLYALVVRH